MNSQKQVLIADLRIADRMWSRMQGLLGTRELASHEGLWIHRCNSIHTFFMNYAIDCIFVDSELRILATRKNVRPWRIVWPVLGARSVFELKSGQIELWQVSPGEQLYVGT